MHNVRGARDVIEGRTRTLAGIQAALVELIAKVPGTHEIKTNAGMAS